MVKLMYMGVMASGFVKGIGGVIKGGVYDVSEAFASELIKNGEWKVVESGEKKQKKKAKFINDEGGSEKW